MIQKLHTSLMNPQRTAMQKQMMEVPSVSVLVHLSSDHWDSNHLRSARSPADDGL